MSAEVLQTISIVAFILAAILAIVAVILFFRLNVRGIIDDLSGKKAERQIRELREQNRQVESENKGRVIYNPSTGKATSKLGFGKKKETTDQLTETTALLHDADATSVLEEEGTTVLEQEEGTTVLGAEEGMTVLGSDEEGTTVLGSDDVLLQNGYRMIVNEIVIHTKERI